MPHVREPDRSQPVRGRFIGGFDLAFERAGARVVAAVEIDKNARKMLAQHFPGVKLFADVREVTGDDLRAAGFVPGRGVLAGGWPCQGNSVAGTRGGMGDPRSGLWREFVRLLAETRPRWFVGENVPGLLTVNGGADIAVVRRDIAQLGYWWAERVLDAQYFGVAQRRERLFFVGHSGDGAAPVEVLLEPEGVRGHPAPGGAAGQGAAAGAGAGAEDGGRVIAPPIMARGRRTGHSGADDSAISVVGALTLGRASHQEAGQGQLIPVAADLPGEGEPPKDAVIAFDNSSAVTVGGDTATTLMANRHGDPGAVASFSWQAAAAADISYGDEVPTLTTSQVKAVHVSPPLTTTNRPAGDPYMAPVEVAHTLTERYDSSEDGCGRGTPLVPVALAENQRGELREMGVSPCVGAEHSGHPGQGRPVVQQSSAVRRLTPTECERLQGFADGWTAGQSDAQRYRQMGNAVAVPVVEWIARRLAAADERCEARGEQPDVWTVGFGPGEFKAARQRIGRAQPAAGGSALW